MTDRTPRVVVAGLGSEYRRDDGAGPVVASRSVEVARAGCDIGPIVDPLDLLGTWDGADLAIVIDAVRSGAPPGTLHVVDLPNAEADEPATNPGETSTHGIGLAGVLRLARAVGHAPRRVVVIGIEGGDFGRGQGLSPAVDIAVPKAVQRVVELIGEVRPCA